MGPLERKALSMLRALEGAGKTVNRISVDGRKIEIQLGVADTEDEFERIDMRHGKT